MNVFRLVLCLAGLLTFLVIRHFSPAIVPPATGGPGQPSLPETPSVGVSPELGVPRVESAAPPGRIEGVSFAPVSKVLRRLEVNGKVVLLKEGSDGLRYTVTTLPGQVLLDNLSEHQFREQEPELFDLVAPAAILTKPNSFLSLKVRADGQFK